VAALPYSGKRAPIGLKKEAEGRKKQNSFHVCFGLYREPMKAYVVHADQVRVVAVPVSGPE
jgi:hypothetical protein